MALGFKMGASGESGAKVYVDGVKTKAKEVRILNISNGGHVSANINYSVSTLPYAFHSGSAVVYNNEIHILGGYELVSKNHYKWDGISWTEVSTLPYDFYDGVCIVRKYDQKEYYLREDGTFISDVGYPSVSPFASGMGTVHKENLSWDWILPNGELFFKKWVKEAHPDFLSPCLHVVFEDDTTAVYDERDNSVKYYNEEG